MTGPVKVLLLGDSIRLSYQPHVATLLVNRAEVVGPADNCQYALFTLASIDRWIQALGKPDIIHWNNGLHDSGHNPNRYPKQIPLDMYRNNLVFILKALHAHTPHIIWATMTPVDTVRRPFQADQWAWRNEEIDSYNQAALAVMHEHQVPVNDLHGLVQPHMQDYLVGDGVHLNEAGQIACAKAVTHAVLQIMEKHNR
ncbi:MAG: hypothetical protein A2498_15190 [Lentisphaerae bacterium RIFOXYC12_FULL_60_16]|nr:MAG: hypothetical protein A2498_15190 [Lentisphaerae bacterium RIFOXYC12_FULL_60_16]OGV73554.1 MAG: hypothetical protein A2269_01930 [Lentisphaerae bacterium RIFOXYA12_FULL_60_10]